MNSEEIDFTDAKFLRSKAEEKLLEEHRKESVLKGEADLQKLHHELQVHQIELEMQNEELTIAREEAEEALRKFTILFDLSSMGYFTLDSEGVICELNYTGAEMLGDRRFSLIGSKFMLFISEESTSVFNDFFKTLYATYVKKTCKVQLGYNNKPSITVYIEGVVNEVDKKCFLSVLDASRFDM